VLTDRMEMFAIDRIELTLPVVVKVAGLDQEAGRQQLLGELRKARDFRLELPCRNGTRAWESLQAALKGVEVGAVIEPTAQSRLKRPQTPSSYALYAEDLMPQDVVRLLQLASQEDRKGRKPAEQQFDRLVVTRMTALDRKELTHLMGVDPTASAAAPTPTGIDPKTPLEELTARQVAAALAGQGGAPRPETGKPMPKMPHRHVLLLAYEPLHADAKSAEVKRFLEMRKPARPGTVRLLLVLRG
jgi:hypothetical protein